MSTNIPEARNRLLDIASRLRNGEGLRWEAANEIESIVCTLMIREFTGRKTPVKHRRMTNELAAEVCDFARRNANLSHEEIARQFDINAGRVSEALSGKRFRQGRPIREDQ